VTVTAVVVDNCCDSDCRRRLFSAVDCDVDVAVNADECDKDDDEGGMHEDDDATS